MANHSGTLPLDGLMMQVAVHDKHPANRHLRLLAADLVFMLPVVNELARKAGTRWRAPRTRSGCCGG